MSRAPFIQFLVGTERWSLPASAVGCVLSIRGVGWDLRGPRSGQRLIVAGVHGVGVIVDEARVWLETSASSVNPRWALVWPQPDGAVARLGFGVCDVLGLANSAHARGCTPARLLRAPLHRGRVAS
jgi:hypothetical protein